MWLERATAAVAVAALVGAAAGCGGGSSRLTKAQYEQRLQTDAKALTQATSALGANVASLTDLKTAVTQARTTIEKAASDLDSLQPPKEAEAANAAFVKALRELDAELGQIEKAVSSGDLAAVIAAAQTLGSSKAVRSAQAAAAQLTKLGYNLGAIGG